LLPHSMCESLVKLGLSPSYSAGSKPAPATISGEDPELSGLTMIPG
jgi:hypothetical protein